MGLREEVKRLRAKVHGAPSSFLLVDGSRFYYDPDTIGIQLFKDASENLFRDADHKPRPEPHPIYPALCEAANRRSAVKALFPTYGEPGSRQKMTPFDLDALVEEGRLEPQRLAKGYEPVEAAPEAAPEVDPEVDPEPTAFTATTYTPPGRDEPPPEEVRP